MNQKNINCLIIEDEPAAARIIENYLKDLENYKIIEKCKSAIEAINTIKKDRIDLMFLDINMPGISGLDFLRSLRNPPLVIITTAYREFAVESFELEVIDYLHKPFSFERFFKAIQRVENRLIQPENIEKPALEAENKDYLFIRSEKKQYKIQLKEILYIEAIGDYCKVKTENGDFLSYMTLKKLEHDLPNTFMRIHKSYIINFNKINYVEGNLVVIQNQCIPIGYTYRKHFFEVIDKTS